MDKKTQYMLSSVVPVLAALITIASCGGGSEVTMVRAGTEAGSSPLVPRPVDSLGVEILPPEMMYMGPLRYPSRAKQAGVTDVVWVKALVDRTGLVREAIVGESSGSTLLDEAAIKSAYKCRFTPAIKNGETVACWVTYKVEFTLDQ